MARQMFAEQGSQFADQQVGALLSSLNIDPAALPGTAAGGGWDAIYGAAGPMQGPEHASQAAAAAKGPQAWVDDFQNMHLGGGARGPGAWASEFQAQQVPGAQPWAEEFADGSGGAAAATDHTKDVAWVDEFQSAGIAAGGDAQEQSRRLAETLAGEGGWLSGACRGCGLGSSGLSSSRGSETGGGGARHSGVACTCPSPAAQPCSPAPIPCSRQGPQVPEQPVPEIHLKDEPRRSHPGGQPGTSGRRDGAGVSGVS